MATDPDAKSSLDLTISKEQKEKITDLLTQVSSLSSLEQWYLYLELPSRPVIEERIKSPAFMVSSFGKRFSAARDWIESHYVEDRKLCVPKQEIYDQYRLFCDSNGLKPVAMTDFGKIVKTAFPNILDRRLGQRGKSKYCYGGLKKRSTSDGSDDVDIFKMEDTVLFDPLDDLSAHLVCEWASSLLGKTFFSLKRLAKYLVSSGASCGQKASLFESLYDSWRSGCNISEKKKPTAQDTQAMLQRKLHQKEVLKEHKCLLKKQEQSQKDLQTSLSQAITRYAVLSPGGHHPSQLCVWNLIGSHLPGLSGLVPSTAKETGSARETETCSDRIEEKYEMCDNTRNSSDVQLDKDAHVPSSQKVKFGRKKSKLITSKSLEESNHNQRQPKRNYDFLLSASPGQECKRRCTTSLGVRDLQGRLSSQCGGEESMEDTRESARLRPVSCPVLYDSANTSECDMESVEMCDSGETYPTLPKSSEALYCGGVETDSNVSKEETVRQAEMSATGPNASSSFHFVRKPISIKPHNKPEVSVNLSLDASSTNQSLLNTTEASPVRGIHNIIKSNISSSDSNLPQTLFANEKSLSFASPSLNQPMRRSNDCTSQSFFQSKDIDKGLRREPHTLDNAYILPRQSSRSAFVPVMNGKGVVDAKFEIGLGPKQLSFDDSFCPSHMKENGFSLTISPKPVEPKEIIDSLNPTCALKSDTDLYKKNEGECVSMKNKVSCKTADQASIHAAIPVAPNTLESVQVKTSQSLCITSPITCQSKKTTVARSPVTPTKRQSPRFTPIRPKLGTPCSLSPHKSDTRPVSTLLKEQRAKSAQELLVSLASSYKGGIPIQMPLEILGFTSPDKQKSSDILLALGNPVTTESLVLHTGQTGATILDTLSHSNFVASQVSPKISSVHSKPTAAIVSPISNTAMISPISDALNISTGLNVDPNVTQSSLIQVSSSSLLCSATLSSPPLPLNSSNQQVTTAGTMPSFMNETSQTLPHAQTGHSSLALLGSAQNQKLISLSDIQGHVVGPDASGQTYLLVPNSEAGIIPKNAIVTTTSSRSCDLTVTSSLSTQTYSSAPTSQGPWSSMLLSELSHLVSRSRQDQNKQLIHHNSATSAFQKCEPNKMASGANITSSVRSLKPAGSDGGGNLTGDFTNTKTIVQSPQTSLENVNESRDSSNSKTVSGNAVLNVNDSCGEANGDLEVGEVVGCKRKASKSRDEKIVEKKRQNTNLAKNRGSYRNKEEASKGTSLMVSVPSNNSMLQTGDKPDMETLLGLISGSASMTVKETVLAMNSLRARMQKTVASSPVSRPCKNTPMTTGSESKLMSASETGEKPFDRKGAFNDQNVATLMAKNQGSSRVKRNASLNLESLESDALIDTDLSLDHQLVGDLKYCRGQGLDQSASVAVGAKTFRSSSADKKAGRRDIRQTHTVSPRALQSYQIILNKKDKNTDQAASVKPPNSSIEKGCKASVKRQKSSSLPRRSASCVKEILERESNSSHTTNASSGSDKSQKKFNSSEVDAFEALLSQVKSKQIPRARSCFPDSEIPGDILDFVTESMTPRHAAHEVSSNLQLRKDCVDVLQYKSLKAQAAVGVRSVSVPNTKPDFFDVGQTVSPSCHLTIQPCHVDSRNTKEEHGKPGSESVFLSPVGPAKLARRSSVEKSMFQGERMGSKTAAEMHSPIPGSHSQQCLTVKERNLTDGCNGQKMSNNEKFRSKTPIDKMIGSEDRQRRQPFYFELDESGISLRAPVNRSLAKTPVEKFFLKQSSESTVLLKSELLSQKSLAQKEEGSSVPTPVSDGGYSGGSQSHTPSSDICGNVSQAQTPISDFGYNSVSPSPVMMSSAAYPSECGRNLSPATIFMPLRSDSALSVSNNTHRSDSPSLTTQTTSVDQVAAFLCGVQSSCSDLLSQKEISGSQSNLTSDTLDIPPLSTNKTLTLAYLEGKEDLDQNSACDSKALFKLISSSLQSIPTPPVSPSSSPSVITSNDLPLAFSIPVSPPLRQERSPSPLSAAPEFLLPHVLSATCPSSTSVNDAGIYLSPSPHCRSQDLPSPAIAARGYAPSPQIPARLPSSPYHFTTSHPSPPFTPCSLRSLPSPRCLTPSSHKSLISPRAVTPSSDHSHVPNGFMPIQSSGGLPLSLAPAHTYIRPIKPVVALASASCPTSNPSSRSRSSNSSSRRTSQSSASHRKSLNMSHQSHTSSSFVNQSLQPMQEFVDSANTIRTSELKPVEGTSTLVLSLTGDVESYSCQDAGRQPWAEMETNVETSTCAAPVLHLTDNCNQLNPLVSVKLTDKTFQKSEDKPTASHRGKSSHKSLGKNKGHKSGTAPSLDSSVVPPLACQNILPATHKHSHRDYSPSLLRLLTESPTFQPSTNRIQINSNNLLGFKPPLFASSMPSLTPLPPSSLSSSLLSSPCVPALKSSSCNPPATQLYSCPGNSIRSNSVKTHSRQPVAGTGTKQTEGREWRSHSALLRRQQSVPPHSVENENIGTVYPAAGSDELQVTLDVLKNMDSQYFLCEEEAL